MWSTEPHLLKILLEIRPTSGKLADCLEGRMSTGDSERACYGFGCEDMLLLKRTAKSSPLNYPGNLGRTCRRQIRHTANARTETFRKLATVAECFIYFVWPQSEVGAHTALLLNAFAEFAVNLAFALHGFAHFYIPFAILSFLKREAVTGHLT